MEHIVQFGISIDEERIKALAAESAAKDIKEELENILIAKGSWTNQYFTTYAEDIFKKVLNEHIDHILDEAVKQIVGSIKNSKKYKMALSSATKEIASTTKE